MIYAVANDRGGIEKFIQAQHLKDVEQQKQAFPGKTFANITGYPEVVEQPAKWCIANGLLVAKTVCTPNLTPPIVTAGTETVLTFSPPPIGATCMLKSTRAVSVVEITDEDAEVEILTDEALQIEVLITSNEFYVEPFVIDVTEPLA